MSVYPEAVGHFVPEHLPKALMMHSVLPKGVQILLADSPVAQRYLAPLLASGALPRERIKLMRLDSLRGATVQAEEVYTLLNSHFSNVIGGDATLRAARAAYARTAGSADAPPPAAATHVLLVDRGKKARHVRNLEATAAALEQAVRATNRTGLRVLRWRPAARVEDDIAAWQRAALVVAPHGAGLANLLFAPAGCPVIEICYDEVRGMLCPAMYAALGANLHLPYWVVTARGGYGSGLQVDTETLLAAATQALAGDGTGAASPPNRPLPRAQPLCANTSAVG